jgi:hypothetical protein
MEKRRVMLLLSLLLCWCGVCLESVIHLQGLRCWGNQRGKTNTVLRYQLRSFHRGLAKIVTKHREKATKGGTCRGGNKGNRKGDRVNVRDKEQERKVETYVRGKETYIDYSIGGVI